MRHRNCIDCNDGNKSHLHRLPNIEPHEIPPRVDNPSKVGLVLIPLFNRYVKRKDSFFVHHGGLSAVWARRSWLVNSDALDHGIDVKLYIENRLQENKEAMSILEQNHIIEDNILWFDGSKVEGAVRGKPPNENDFISRTAKKLMLVVDRRLCEYDWVFQLDSDVFVIKNGSSNLSFFSDFFKNAPTDQIASGFMSSHYSTVKHILRVRDGYGLEEWKSDFESLLGSDMLDRFTNPARSFSMPHNMFIAFPAKHFMNKRWDDCEKLVEIARIMICDESALGVWHALGNEIYDIRDLDNCPIVRLMKPNSHHDIQRMNDLSELGVPHLLHYGGNEIEQYWRRGIGAY